MKPFIAILLAGLLMLNVEAAAPIASASNSPTLTVYDFRATREGSRYGQQLTALVTANLSMETNLVVVERVQLSKALSEQAFGVSGMVNSQAAAQIGAMTGAKVLVSGNVMVSNQKHLVVLANIVGTETGRLFAVKAEGSADNLSELSDSISAKIVKLIQLQVTNLLAPTAETSAEQIARIIKNLKGTNRPSVSVEIEMWSLGRKHHGTAANELGSVLLKAGFPVVDSKSDHKPDIQITGAGDLVVGSPQGELQSYRAVVEVKVQDRRTGNILMFDRKEGTAMSTLHDGLNKEAQARAADALAEDILPMLAAGTNSPTN